MRLSAPPGEGSQPARPLQGRTVLVTRPRHQARPLVELVGQAGGRALVLPALEIVPLPEPLLVAAAPAGEAGGARGDKGVRAEAGPPSLIVFVSPNAVRHGLDAVLRMAAPEPGGSPPVAVPLAAVGEGTARALEARGRAPGITPPPGAPWSSEGLLQHPALAPEAIGGARVWIVRGRGGRELLARELRRRGALPVHLEVYERRGARPCARELGRVREAGRTGELDAVVVTSGEAATHLLGLLAGERWLEDVFFVVPSARVGGVLVGAGIRGARVVVAERSGDAELLEAAIRAVG